jgi:hypothetical protein
MPSAGASSKPRANRALKETQKTLAKKRQELARVIERRHRR